MARVNSTGKESGSNFSPDNGTGSAVRTAMKDIFESLRTVNSASGDPSGAANLAAYQLHIDSDTDTLKIRNGANSGFVSLGNVSQTNFGFLSASGGTLTGVLAASAGSASAPALHFGDSTTGLFKKATNQIGLSFSQTETTFFDQNGITLNNQKELRLSEPTSAGSEYVGFKAPDTLAGNVVWKLPNADTTVSGYALVSDGSGNLSWGVAGSNAVSNRNKIINGASQIAQRLTNLSSSVTGITNVNACKTVDRWKVNKSSGSGTVTMSQSTDAPTDNGFAFSTKYEITTAATDLSSGKYFIHVQRLEGQDLQNFCKGTSNAKKFSLSFFVKTNKTGTYNVELHDQDNTRHCVQSYTVSNTNWNKYTLTFPADTTGAFDNDKNASLDLNFWLAGDSSTFGSGTRATTWAAFAQGNRAVGNVNLSDSTSNEWYITGVQLEVGDVSTDYEFKTFHQELYLCQRYYYVYMPQNSNSQNLGIGAYTGSGNQFEISIRHPVVMRAFPTYEESGGTNFFANFVAIGGNATVTYDGFTNDQLNDRSTGLFTLSAGSHGGKAGRARMNSASASMAFDAEL